MTDVLDPLGYEPSDADPRLLGALAAGCGSFLLLVPFALMLIYPNALRVQEVPRNPPEPPQPRLQTNPKVDTDRLHATEYERLAQFTWVDRDGGIVRIPIERAMELVAKRGIPGWPGRR